MNEGIGHAIAGAMPTEPEIKPEEIKSEYDIALAELNRLITEYENLLDRLIGIIAVPKPQAIFESTTECGAPAIISEALDVSFARLDRCNNRLQENCNLLSQFIGELKIIP